MVVEVGGAGHLFAREIPAGAIAVGVVRDENGKGGALVRFRDGTYAQLNGNAVRPLDRIEVLRAMSAGLQAILRKA